MNKYEKYLLVSDLDGTLINSQHVIPQENLSAIQYFIEHGGSFSIATGRTIHNIRPFIKNLTTNTPCILYNGSAIYDFEKEKLLKVEYLEKSLLKEYIAYCIKTFEHMVVEIFTPKMLYIVTSESNIDPFVMQEKQIFENSTLDEVSRMDWIKILLNDKHENLLLAQQALVEFGLTIQIDSVFSQDYYLELLGKGVSKGSALSRLRQFPQLKDKFVVAVGDYDNDIEMIKVADVGIATDNANDCVKIAADKITVNNDQNAIYDIIYNIIPMLSKEITEE